MYLTIDSVIQTNITNFKEETNIIIKWNIQDDITYLKAQYKVFLSDNDILFTVFYRKLCRSYKKQIYYLNKYHNTLYLSHNIIYKLGPLYSVICKNLNVDITQYFMILLYLFK